ncbi:MAG: class I SAM-dependent methyltransferase [Limisphaerales bacterium]
MIEPPSQGDNTTEYEDYEATSGQYDETRRGVGVGFIAEALNAVGPMDEHVLLDAGCGTGTYIDAFKDRVRSVVGVDLNQGMLDQAERKFRNDSNVTLKQGSLVDIPCEDREFDAATCNQVVHHLASGEESTRFDGIQNFAHEAFRVLRPGGVFVLNTSSPEQQANGFWWASLIPEAVARLGKRFPEIERIHEMLAEAGFEIGETEVMKGEVLQGENYLDSRGPLKANWRDGDSAWSMVEPEELAKAMEHVTEMNAAGSMQSYQDDREALRCQIGQTTSISAFRPA